jgi:hypothetical protein
MDEPTSPARWPWRKWFLAGALSGAATTIVGPVSLGACGGAIIQSPDDAQSPQDACAAFDACAQPCAASADACAIQIDAVVPEDAGESGADDGPSEASDGDKPAG